MKTLRHGVFFHHFSQLRPLTCGSTHAHLAITSRLKPSESALVATLNIKRIDNRIFKRRGDISTLWSSVPLSRMYCAKGFQDQKSLKSSPDGRSSGAGRAKRPAVNRL
ncbi:hypothetical protein LAD67_07765 [Escherichia coli]|nr:hypothetical protein [Escherichia coli]